jgi:AcrR family transcriptional regulator
MTLGVPTWNDGLVTQPGRREAHKVATRQALQEAALRMFEQHGYAATTVRDIASAAGVTERTFFRYFPSKEDLVLGEIVDLIPVLQEQVRARPAEEPPYTAVLHALLAIAARRGAGLGIMFSGPPARFLSQATRPAQPVLRELEDGLAHALESRLYGAEGVAETAGDGSGRDAGGPTVAGSAGGGAEDAGGGGDAGSGRDGGGGGGGDGGGGDGGGGGRGSGGGRLGPPAVSGPSLGTAVLARACVAAMRSTLIAYSALPEREKTLETVLRLVREAFAALRRG